MDDLVSLYQKIGINEYDWKYFGPDLRNTEWNYFSFEPAEKQPFDKSPWRYRPVTVPQGMKIELRENGVTDSTSFLWPGDILLDLDRSQALKMTPKTIDGGEYLFLEAGGFGPKNPIGWKSQWMVLKRK